MKKLILATASVSILAIGAASAQTVPLPQKRPVTADQSYVVAQATTKEGSEQVLGTTAGAGAGAVAGAAIGGPIGALIGGFAGAVIGSASTVPQPAVDYVVAHPVKQVAVTTNIEAGATLPAEVQLQPIPDYPDYSYAYVDGRPVIVKAQAREVVYSPGYVVPDQTVTYVEQNPVEPVQLGTTVKVGATIPAEVTLNPVPDNQAYSYVYTDAGPILVQNNTRTVVWVKG